MSAGEDEVRGASGGATPVLPIQIGAARGYWVAENTAASLVGYLKRLERLLLERNGARPQLEAGVVAFADAVAATFRECAEDGTSERLFEVAAGLSVRDLVDVSETARLLGCGERNVRALAARGSLPAVRGRPLMFARAEVLDRIDRRTG